MGATSAAELLRDVDTSALGSRIRSERVTRGWTQAQLAGDELSTGYLSRIESGARRPTLTVLTELARRLDVPVVQLLNGTGAEYDEIRLCLDYAELALENGEAGEAENQARDGVTRAEAASLKDFVARGHYLLGRAYEMQDRLDEAVDEYEQALRGDSELLALTTAMALTRCHILNRDHALAVETGQRAWDRAVDQKLDHTDEALRLSLTVASAYLDRGDVHHGARLCAAAVRRAEATASPLAKASAYHEASIAQDEAGRTQDAIALASRALAFYAETSDRHNAARIRLEYGRMLLASDQVAESVKELARARDEFVDTRAGGHEIAENEVTLAEAYLRAGDLEEASTLAERARTFVDARAPMIRVRALLVRAQVSSLQGLAVDAEQARHDVMTLLERVDDPDAPQAWCDLAELLQHAGDIDGALLALKRATASAGLTSRVVQADVAPIG